MIFMALFYFLLAILTISLSNDLFGYINLTNVYSFLNFGRVVIIGFPFIKEGRGHWSGSVG